ncbi:MAG: hypothetical protein AAGI17_08675 [Planctomycetota bacterium]
MTRLRLSTTLVFLAATALAPLASAQNALGDGRGLENRRITNGRGNYNRPDFIEEVRFRNSIVTGNAPNFLSFRGDLPFTDPDSFRGDLGSNDLFAFRRDSLFSGLAGQGVRGTEAIQFQAALTTNTSPPPGLVGAFIVDRAGTGASGSDFARFRGAPSGIPNGLNDPGNTDGRTTLIQDPNAVNRGYSENQLPIATGFQDALRSPSAYLVNRDYRPAFVGTTLDAEQNRRILTATSLLGVQLLPTPEQVNERRSRLATVADATAVNIEERDRGQRRSASRLDQRTEVNTVDRRVVTGHDLLIEKIETAAPSLRVNVIDEDAEDEPAETPTTIPSTTPAEGESGEEDVEPWRRGLIDLRNWVNAPLPIDTPDARRRYAELVDARTERPAGEPADPNNPDEEPTEVDVVLQSEQLIDELIRAPEGVEDSFLRLMVSGQQAIVEGNYFDAEEAFALALSVKPQDPTAQVGRVHAQLGAGLLLSASINLRQLLVFFPELAVARFGRQLLPPAERLSEIVAQLERYIDPNSTALVAPALRREAGLLLAYIGRHTRDDALVRRGLDDFARTVQGDPATVADDAFLEQRLVRVLRSAWLPAGTLDSSPGGPPNDE